MASYYGILCTFLAIILAATNTWPIMAIEEFQVGDAEGWQQPPLDDSELYTHWASKIRFHVGDSLRFQYNNDSVVVVNKWGYYHCNTSNPTSVFDNGNTVVTLDKAGPIYFISGDPDHCKGGQRLAVKVISLHPKSYSPPSMAPAPSPHSSSEPSVSVATLSILVAIVVSLVGSRLD